jgi:16S rRNA G1207 methylase RsmC
MGLIAYVASNGSTMTKEKVDELTLNPPVEGQDTVDQALIRAAETDLSG